MEGPRDQLERLTTTQKSRRETPRLFLCLGRSVLLFFPRFPLASGWGFYPIPNHARLHVEATYAKGVVFFLRGPLFACRRSSLAGCGG